MIIVRIQGGLGNQLFQYAAARCLAERLGTVCKLDTSSLHTKQLRQLDLDKFSAGIQVANKKEIRQFSFFPALYRHSPAFFSMLGKNIYREPHYHFDEKFFNLKDPVYLDGYFQSEQYFKPIESIIRTAYTINPSLTAHLNFKKEELLNRESISVHIRRGDYTQKKLLKVHGLQPASYYNHAIKTMAEKIHQPFFYFFSDDIEWVKTNIELNYPHEFVSGITQSAIEDFFLMSQCRHNIIANSSFSWWAAWLNANTNKQVIAPAKWFNQSANDTKDLIPAGWLTL